MHENPLQTPVQYVAGVGPRRADLLARLELHTAEDLLWFLPRDVLDLSDVRGVERLEAGELQSVRGTVVDLDGKKLTGGRTLVAILLDCGGDYVRGSWFNQAWMLQKFREGDVVLFSGKPKRRAGRWEFAHPQVQWLEDDDPDAHGGVLPRYRLTEGIKMHEMRRIVRTAVESYVDSVPEYLPAEFRASLGLPDLRRSIRQLHMPRDMAEYEAARKRLLFDDLLEFQLGLAIKRRAWKGQDRAAVLPTTAKIDARIRRLFPFEFTEGQNTAVRDISADLASGRAMHRLLQADVGAGKTAVAVYAILVAVAAGYQAVLMAPTEVLASQHWQTIEGALAGSRVNRLLLTGNLTAAQRRQALAEIASGAVHLVVGTQAVIQKDVRFHRLGLAVIDEQHKFGVVQRAHFLASSLSSSAPASSSSSFPRSAWERDSETLRVDCGEGFDGGSAPGATQSVEGGRSLAERGNEDEHGQVENLPHVLVMTATPIPRSLCLTQFGDLDLTIIPDMPPGRQPVVTSRVTGAEARRKAWDFVRKQIRSGRQAYIVCPRVEGSDDGTGAERVYGKLVASEVCDFQVGLVHGQMDKQAKADAMDAFRTGRTQLLVSTTVVEVGVDVPNATLMLILEAERFGLSQLHQLRGRIARGKYQGYCFLFSDSDSSDAVERLAALEATTDGFKIAEADFELRGPGDVLGVRQHGDLPLKVADLRRDHDVLLDARRAAFELAESGRLDQPDFVPLKVRVLERFGKFLDLPQSG